MSRHEGRTIFAPFRIQIDKLCHWWYVFHSVKSTSSVMSHSVKAALSVASAVEYGLTGKCRAL
jgi:hypothetical protein